MNWKKIAIAVPLLLFIATLIFFSLLDAFTLSDVFGLYFFQKPFYYVFLGISILCFIILMLKWTKLRLGMMLGVILLFVLLKGVDFPLCEYNLEGLGMNCNCVGLLKTYEGYDSEKRSQCLGTVKDITCDEVPFVQFHTLWENQITCEEFQSGEKQPMALPVDPF